MSDDSSVHDSSGNVFADLELKTPRHTWRNPSLPLRF